MLLGWSLVGCALPPTPQGEVPPTAAVDPVPPVGSRPPPTPRLHQLDRCDGEDSDGDGLIDEDPDIAWFEDLDGDGFGNPDALVWACTQPARTSATAGDCGDTDPRHHGVPGPIRWHREVFGPPEAALEAWDGVRRCNSDFLMSGASVADVDGDDDLDVFLTRVGFEDVMLRNDGTGHFTVDMSFPPNAGGSGGSVFFDAEGDGDLDLYVVAHGRHGNALYINDGTGQFVDEAAMRGAERPTDDCSGLFGVSAGDVDGDDDLDLIMVAWHEPQDLGVANRSGLLLNDGTGHFVDATEPWGLDELRHHAAFAPLLADYDRDGRIDLHLSADFETSALFRNTGARFEKVATNVFTDEAGMGSDLGDVDADGDLDWFVGSISADAGLCDHQPCTGNRLYALQDGVFTDQTDAFGLRHGQWTWGAVFIDHDLDGDLDLATTGGFVGVGLLDRLGNIWRNQGGGDFVDVTCDVGFDYHEQGRTLVAFDADRDGDLELVLTDALQRPTLWRNAGAEGRGWMTLTLEQPGGNPNAVGAEVTVYATPEDGQLRLLHANALYLGSGPPEVHVGLGAHEGPVHEVVVRWPDGVVDRYANVPQGRVTLRRAP